MSKEDKKLLLKYLCASLPYENWVQYNGKDYMVTGYGHGRVSLLPSKFSSAVGPCPLFEEIRPYLRSLDDMTPDDAKSFRDLLEDLAPEGKIQLESGVFRWNDAEVNNFSVEELCIMYDWFHEHHFDYRGLIRKGLAIKVTKENNPYI